MLRLSYDNGVGSWHRAAWLAMHWGSGRGYVGGWTLRIYAGPAWHRWSPREWLSVARALNRARKSYSGSAAETYTLVSFR